MAIKKMADGTWLLDFYLDTFNGKKERKRLGGFKTKKAAEEFKNKLLDQRNGNSKVSFHAVLDEYYTHTQKTIKKHTNISRKNTLNKIKELAPDVPINELNQKYFFVLFEQMNDCPGVRKLAKSYINLTLDYCKINYNLKTNVCREYRLPRIVKEVGTNIEFEEVNKIWTLQEFYSFMETVKKMQEFTSKKYTALYYLLYFTGARIGEILALTKKDIDLDNNIISIFKTRVNLNEDNTPKTKASRRKVSIDNTTKEKVKEYLELVPDTNNLKLFGTYNTVKSTHTVLVKKSGLNNIGLHGLRHSHASLLIEMGINIVDISKRLGHDNPGITLKTYSHFYKKENDLVIEKLNEINKK